jgi:hypothetical protein
VTVLSIYILELLMNKILLTAILLFSSTIANAEGTNFSYTTLGVSAGSTNITPPLCLTANTCYSSFTNFGINGSYQFNGDFDWLYLSLSSSDGASSNNGVDFRESVGSVGINFVKAINNVFDIIGGVESLSATDEACVGSNCVSVSDKGVGLIFGAQAWASDAKSLAIGININFSKLSQSTSASNGSGVGLNYYGTKNHAVGAAYGTSNSNGITATSVGVSYAYHF